MPQETPAHAAKCVRTRENRAIDYPLRNTRDLLAAALASVLWCAGATAQIRLPDFGDSSQSVVSAATERALGRAFMREIRATMTVIDDPEVEDYVQSLGYRLVSSTDQQNLAFTFFVVKDPVINAFAAPGGWVGINSGLLVATERESELASVMAHEIAHVTQRHIARAIELNESSQIAALAGILAAIAIGTQNSEAGQAAAAAVLGSTAQRQINFTRDNEHEADRVGIQLLNGAGFDPSAMAGFFEKLQTAGRYYRAPPEFLSTHPVTTSRIAEARDRAIQLGTRQHVDSRRFRMVRGKLRVLTEEDNDRLTKEFREEIALRAPAPAPGLRYGLALVHARAGRLEEAREEFEALSAAYPDDVALRMALAQLIMRMGQSQRAMAVFDDAWKLRPDDRLVTRHYAGALLDSQRPRDALRVLDDYARLATPDAVMMHQRAQALQALGRTAESQAALAEHYYRRGQLDAAIHQLGLAAAQPGNDFYRASRIEARLEEIRNEQAARVLR
jgi:predicted Zn-dependent protease